MRAFLSNSQARGDAFWDCPEDSPLGPVFERTSAAWAEAEARRILAESEHEEGPYKACFVSPPFLRQSRMPLHVEMRAAAVEALAAFVEG